MHQIENSYVQVCMHMCDSIKGHGQVLDRAIVLSSGYQSTYRLLKEHEIRM